jgi:hypothetical protein
MPREEVIMVKMLISASVAALVLAGCHRDSHGVPYSQMVRTPAGTMGMSTPRQPILPDGPGSGAIEPERRGPGAAGAGETGVGNPR